MDGDWISHGKVRARETEGLVEVVVDGLTTQTKYYKPLVYEFFRKAWRGARPSWGEFSVDIMMVYVGDPPWIDLDNLAKAILEGRFAAKDTIRVSCAGGVMRFGKA